MNTRLVLMLTAVLLAAPATTAELAAQQERTQAEARAAATADSLSREARTALNRGEYRRAAAMFRSVYDRHGRAAAAQSALYWQAFALYRSGGSSDLRAARSALQLHQEQYPEMLVADARTLELRINSALAQQGDPWAAQAVTVAAAPPAPSAVPAPEAPAPPRAPAPPAPYAGAGRPADCPDDDDHEVRVAALNALLQVDAERAMPILQQVLQRRDPCSVELRRRAVFLVQQKRAPETTRILLDIARNDPDAEVRGQAVHWLSSVNTDEAVNALDEILRTSTDPQLRERAVFALSQHRSERAASIIRRIAEDEQASVELRQRAVFWLGQRRGEGTGDYLRTLYGRTQNEHLRERILFSISQSRDEADRRWLLELAMRQSEPLELRKRALFWAAQRRTPEADLVALYDRMPEREMREQLIYLYAQQRSDEHTSKLIDIVRTERDPELRKRAIFWLSQSRDPRAADVLREVITP